MKKKNDARLLVAGYVVNAMIMDFLFRYRRRSITTARGWTIASAGAITATFSYSSSHCRCTWRPSLASRRTFWYSTRTVLPRYPPSFLSASSRWLASSPCPSSASPASTLSSSPEDGRPMNRFATNNHHIKALVLSICTVTWRFSVVSSGRRYRSNLLPILYIYTVYLFFFLKKTLLSVRRLCAPFELIFAFQHIFVTCRWRASSAAASIRSLEDAAPTAATRCVVHSLPGTSCICVF